MSWNPLLEAGFPDAVAADAIATLIVPRTRDLGDFEVRRALPTAQRQMVGPFILFDQAGPAEMITGQGVDVRPHPHIGLATVTYLYRGEFQHRDSLGTNQMILPGAVNWMVAARGVTHSERTSAATARGRTASTAFRPGSRCPRMSRTRAPSFEHHAEKSLPLIEGDGASVRLILGEAYGEKAPAKVFSETVYADAMLRPFAKLPLPDNHEDRGVYIVEGAISVAGQTFEAGRMLVFRPKDAISVAAGPKGARPDGAGRRDAERAALHLVELCRLQPREDRRGARAMAQRRLGPRPVRPAARRPGRVHPAA